MPKTLALVTVQWQTVASRSAKPLSREQQEVFGGVPTTRRTKSRSDFKVGVVHHLHISRTKKIESIELAKGAATDSTSRVPCTPEEMNSANLKREVFWSGDIQATSKEGGPKIVKISSQSSSLRQDKKEHTEGTLAHITHAISASEELEPRENKSRPQHLSQIGFFSLPSNKRKLTMLIGAAIATSELQEAKA
ncbi:hypothetical protein Ancab_032473 [Ancistrocladus abbreviatus]